MNRKPYSTYHGRKTLLQRILTAVAVILAVALLLALVALLVLPNYMTYTGDGLQFNVPLPKRPAQTAQPQPSAAASGDPEFVIDDQPSAAPSAGATAETDLSRFERRDVPLGLVVAAGAGPREQDGYVFHTRVTTVGVGDGDMEGNAEFHRSLLYSAAYIDPYPDWDSILDEDENARTTGFADYITQWCMDCAARGYDEIILSDTVTADNDPKGEAQAALYRRIKSELDQAGWQGRLGLVLDQSWAGSGYDADLMPAIAQSFDRLYFRRAMQSNVKTALTANGFDNKPANYVTIYDAIPNVNWAWAVL